MQFSLEKLRSLSEADLRRKVLIPLFRAMGFRDVTEVHGSRELGKDIVMWKVDHFRGRVNYAVVAKAQKVTTGPQSAGVSRQIRESFGSSYTDPISLEEREVNRVIVVTSKEFTGEAKDSLRSELRSLNLEGTTDLLGGEKLFEMVREYLPEAVVWDPLQKASKALREASDNWDFTLQVGPDGVPSLFVSDRHPDAQICEPIAGSMTLRFPPTPEGMQKRAEYQRFLETGSPVELSGENIHAFEIPEFLRSLASEGEITTLVLGPSPLSETMLRRLLVLDQLGQVIFSIDYIHLTHRQGGYREFSLDNRGQPIPFRLRLIFNKETGQNAFHLNFEPKGANVLQFLRWLLLRKAATEGQQLVLADWNTGLFELVSNASAFDFSAPSKEEVELAERLVFIQNCTGVEISLTEDGRFTMQDLANSELAGRILADGRTQLPMDSISFSPCESSEWESKIGEKVTFSVVEGDFALDILGSRIPFGEAHILCRGTLRRVSAEQGEHRFRVEASEGEPFLAVFPKWLRQNAVEEPSASATDDERA